MSGESLDVRIKTVKTLNLVPINEQGFNRKMNINLCDEKTAAELCSALEYALRVAIAKNKSRELGFICTFTDGNGNYWFKISRGLSTALSETMSTLDVLSDSATKYFNEEQKQKLNALYRLASELL